MNIEIDISKLENVKRQPDGSIIAGCPCCIENGRDHTKDHFKLWIDKRFSCISAPGDKEHNKRILELVGINIDSGKISEVNLARKQPISKQEKNWNINVLQGLIKNYDYWNKRNLSDQTCQFFNIGIAYKGQMANRSILPIIDKYNPNKIIGFSGRALKKDMNPKWKHIGEKSLWLMPAMDSEIQKTKTIILVESPGCFLTLFDYNIKNTICLFGTNISSKIMSYIIGMNPDRILIATNNELDSINGGVGNKAALKLKKQLEQFFNSEKIIIALPEGGKDFNDLSKENIEKYINKYNLR